MTNIAVCIPSIGRSELLSDLVDACLAEESVDVVEVWDNAEIVPDSWPAPARTIYAPGLTIYDEWNTFAEDYGTSHHLAFLNDDIELVPRTLPTLARALRGDYGAVSVAPDQTQAAVQPATRVREVSGTFRQHGMCGWAFLVRQGCWPLGGIDGAYRVWFGDDDLVWKMRQDGFRVGVVDGVSVRHETSTTSNQLDWVEDARRADAERWKKTGRP